MANMNATSHAGYSGFLDEDGNEYGSFEVYYFDKHDKARMRQEMIDYGIEIDDENELLLCGWYWQSGMPGCLYDSEIPNGPYNTSKLAYLDAREE